MSVADTAAEILGKLVAECSPRRAYVHVGQVAFDQCDELVVAIVGIRPGTPGGDSFAFAQTVCGPVTVRARVVRTWCVPVADPPTTKQLHASGMAVTDDLDHLWSATISALAAVDCAGRIIGAEAIGPDGGQVGWGIDIEWTR